MAVPRKGGPSLAKAAVVAAIVGAVVFGLYVGYLEWTYDSFPVRQEPFGSYAQVVYSGFNGTEYSFGLKWLNASYVPLYAQVTSDTDAGNTIVCGVGPNPPQAGGVFYMPFAASQTSAVLQNVQLSVAVGARNTTKALFTIQYDFGTVSASAGDVVPISGVCKQPQGVE
jgi:hypothetical protein